MSVESDRYYWRNPSATAVTSGAMVLFVVPGRKALEAPGVDPAAVATLWEDLATPRPGNELEVRLAALPDGVPALVEKLVAGTFVLRGMPEEAAAVPLATASRGGASRPCRSVVLGVTGAVQAAFTPLAVQRLLAEFTERLEVVLTRSARRFVRPRALSLLGAGVWYDSFQERAGVPVPHVQLASTELVVVYPATADSLYRLAHGAASDLLSLVVCATRAPVVVVPSMNEAMWRGPAVRRNVETLRRDGRYVLEPGPGASAAVGGGRQLGGAGLGADAVNLVGALEAVLSVSR